MHLPVLVVVACAAFALRGAEGVAACGTAQIPNGSGGCTFCGVGQVANAGGTACVACPAGTAKSPAGGNVVNAVCSRCPSTIQYAIGTGVCLSCTQAGTVANAAGTGCEPCPAGTARVPPSGTTGAALSATCVPVTQGGCGTAQFANGTGLCQICGAGQVTSADGAGCQFCPAGTAKTPAGMPNNAACAKCPGTVQYGNGTGVCLGCPAGQLANAAGTGCEPCPAGTARVPPSGQTGAALTSTCVPVTQGGCGTAQFANGTGLCQTCGASQVTNSDGTGCQFCPPGTTKTPAGMPTNAVCSKCSGSAQYTDGTGICYVCPAGQVANAAGTACEPCPAGTARVPPSGTSGAALNATCVPVRQGGCGTGQYAIGTGLCLTCGDGEVGNEDGTGCTRCPPGTGKVRLSFGGVNATCVQCDGNTISTGSGICTSCPDGEVANYEHTTCGEVGILITEPGEAYGHHGQCQGWNGCGDAATCALLACRAKGYSRLVRFGAAKPCTQFTTCNLVNCCDNPLGCQGLCSDDPCTSGVQYDWGSWCDVLGVTDIYCADDNFVCPTIMAAQLMNPRPMMAAAAAGAKEGPDPTASSETMAAFESNSA